MTIPPRSRSTVHPDAPDEPDELGPLSDDAITGSFRILQRVHGHRYSLDDVITAWEGAQAAPGARHCLELGSGIGSVLLMLAYKLPEADFVAVEAQRNSFKLLTQNIARNGLGARVRPLLGDLRDLAWPELRPGGFDLITGTPPYVIPGSATPSTDAQRAFARQEYRGGVEEYLIAGARCLAPHGRLVVCADARAPERVLERAGPAGLRVLRRRDVIPRAVESSGSGRRQSHDNQPLFTVFTLCPAAAAQQPPLSGAGAAGAPAAVGAPNYEHSRWIARDAQGARTEAYHALRQFFGLAIPTDEAPSP